MTLPIVFRPEVVSEIEQIGRHYEQEKEGLGERFLLTLDEAIEMIGEFPEGPAIVYRDVRVRTTPKFPYGVYYRVLSGQILVIAVVHLHRRASSWKSRLN